MKERKNLEHLFQERFENFEMLPPENVWEEIKIKLEEKEDKRRAIPFWWKFSGIAAALVIGLFLLNTNFNDAKPADKIITNSDDLLAPEKNNSGPDDVKNTETSVTVSDTNNASDTNINAIAISKKVNSSNSDLKQKSTTTLNRNNSSDNNSTVAENNSDSEKSNKNRKKLNTTLNKNSTTEKSRNVVAENDSEKSDGASTLDRISKIQKKKTTKSSIAINSEKENEENTFYNYKNNKVIVAETSEKKQILSDKKTTSFNKNESFSAIKLNENNSDNSFAEINSDKNTNENSILNIGIRNTDIKNNTNTFNSDFDKNIVINTNENELKLAEENKIDSTTIAVVEPNALEELLKEKEGKIVNAKEPKVNRWQVTTNVAPIYFSSTGNDGSALDSKFANNSKSYSTNYSYGVGVNYKVAKKFKLRTGVNSVSFNYDTNDVVFFQSSVTSKIKNVEKNERGAFIEIQSKNENGVNTPSVTESGFELNKFESSLNQKLGYIEVPVEMSYTVLDKKFKIEILGGLSTLFLNQNEVYLESSGLKMDIGKATNLNDVHFSGNIGLGFKYGFLKNLEAKVEPVFKYQMNTYTTDTGNFKPYFIGVYTGLTYNF